ncbi:nitrate ABC transporter substrate-binding protein [Actinomadura sp. KC216]|uniref:ABC transporter substrate-binding protein n=1 Tax=Actinomadura sp. KC216 TaxID=2530370 RepID=UPI001042CBA7|nr:ABC transporter substrate-binding protein [Actinomadura sp. KC216]TDB90698.1 nitrate ABC transporter substrate-binding protein [Actinomadura sp. KC216]
MWKRPLAVPAVAIAAVLAVSGCGGSSGESGDDRKLSVGLVPVADVAPIFIGISKGFFKKEGLEIETRFAAGGAAIVPSVMGGDFQIGYSNNVSLIVGHARGLPLRAVAPGYKVGTTDGSDPCRVIAAKTSDVRRPSDLQGKSIALNTLAAIGEVTVRASLAKQGVDLNTIKFTEIPFSDMNAALANKRVDAVWNCEPFVTQAVAAGHRSIMSSMVGTQPGLQITSYFTKNSYAEKNKATVERFTRALAAATAYAREHPDEARTEIARFAEIPNTVIGDMTLPTWTETMDPGSFRLLGELSHRYGLIKKPADVNDLVSK